LQPDDLLVKNNALGHVGYVQGYVIDGFYFHGSGRFLADVRRKGSRILLISIARRKSAKKSALISGNPGNDCGKLCAPSDTIGAEPASAGMQEMNVY
jgi:hypothetical protein